MDDPTGRDTSQAEDLSARPVSALLLWGVPMVALLATNVVALPQWALTVIWAAGFSWMGVGCLINARRCHRRHCYLAGPVLLAGALAIALVGFGLVSLGRDGFILVVFATFALVALTFVPEFLWGRYAKR